MPINVKSSFIKKLRHGNKLVCIKAANAQNNPQIFAYKTWRKSTDSKAYKELDRVSKLAIIFPKFKAKQNKRLKLKDSVDLAHCALQVQAPHLKYKVNKLLISQGKKQK